MLEYHIDLLNPFVDELIVPTRPSWIEIVEKLVGGTGARVLALETNTMSETVLKVLAGKSFDSAMVGMPDTYLSSAGSNPYRAILESSLVSEVGFKHPGAIVGTYTTGEHQKGQVGSVSAGDDSRVSAHADKDQERDYGRHWGQIYANQLALSLLDERTPHVGYVLDSLLAGGHKILALEQEGNYVDCGTFEEYRRIVVES